MIIIDEDMIMDADWLIDWLIIIDGDMIMDAVWLIDWLIDWLINYEGSV